MIFFFFFFYFVQPGSASPANSNMQPRRPTQNLPNQSNSSSREMSGCTRVLKCLTASRARAERERELETMCVRACVCVCVRSEIASGRLERPFDMLELAAYKANIYLLCYHSVPKACDFLNDFILSELSSNSCSKTLQHIVFSMCGKDL